jgi:hypothetical protein
VSSEFCPAVGEITDGQPDPGLWGAEVEKLGVGGCGDGGRVSCWADIEVCECSRGDIPGLVAWRGECAGAVCACGFDGEEVRELVYVGGI